MILYFLSARDANGESLDWFVSALCPEDALRAYLSFLAAESWDEPDGKITVFPVPPVGDSAQVHDWPHAQSLIAGGAT